MRVARADCATCPTNPLQKRKSRLAPTHNLCCPNRCGAPDAHGRARRWPLVALVMLAACVPPALAATGAAPDSSPGGSGRSRCSSSASRSASSPFPRVSEAACCSCRSSLASFRSISISCAAPACWWRSRARSPRVPTSCESGLADLRLALPLALLASASSIAGAMIGLAMSPATVQIALGVTILGIVALMASARKSELPDVATPDRLSAALGIHGDLPRCGKRTRRQLAGAPDAGRPRTVHRHRHARRHVRPGRRAGPTCRC